jgi:hypothetical protein
MSQFHYLEDKEIMSALADGAQIFRACQADAESTYLVLTVPESSEYRNASVFSDLVGLLAKLEATPKIYKAAGSNDIQIFLSFSEPVKTEEIAYALTNHLNKHGFAIGPNHLIVHIDEPFVIPLQNGFCWLNDLYEPKLQRDEIALHDAMAFFLKELDTDTSCPGKFLAALDEKDFDFEEKPASAPAVLESSDALSLDGARDITPAEEIFEVVSCLDVAPISGTQAQSGFDIEKSAIGALEPVIAPQAFLAISEDAPGEKVEVSSNVGDLLNTTEESIFAEAEPSVPATKLEAPSFDNFRASEKILPSEIELHLVVSSGSDIFNETEESAVNEMQEIVVAISNEPSVRQLSDNASNFPTAEILLADDTVGLQLLLFAPTPIQESEISELPKGRPKRGNKARSNLPEAATAVTPAQNKFFSTQ